MTQTDLFAASHHNDPDTSREAAARMDRSGKRKANAEQVFQAVRIWPGCTSAEIGRICELLFDLTETRRRLSDLKRDGKVEQGPARRCHVKGSRMVTWRASDDQ